MVRNILCTLQTILQTFPCVFLVSLVLTCSNIAFDLSLSALGPVHPCCRSEPWQMKLKIDIKSSVPSPPVLLYFLCNSFKSENCRLSLLEFQSIEPVK